MKSYQVVVVGGGPAGMMAAIRAGAFTKGVILFEKNASLARKLSLTGKGRCNVTNESSYEDFVAVFGKNGAFLRQSFSRFFVDDLKDFFQKKGCSLKIERQGRIFPASDTSTSVISVLKKALDGASVHVALSAGVLNISDEGVFKKITFADGTCVSALKVILAMGGVSYPQTGSTGDGFKIARSLGHHIEELYPGLVPLETLEAFVKELQGLTLKNIALTFECGGKKIETPVGELLFTHFGVSGPLVLDVSASLNPLLKRGALKMLIDLKPGLTSQVLEAKLQNEWRLKGTTSIKNYLKTLAPLRLVDVILNLSKIDASKKCHQVTAAERKSLLSILKALPLTIRKTRLLSEAMVTCGGISLDEVNPKTMESRKVKGLYFCGEILDLAASSGGYNLQAAFSTGWVAGEAAALSLRDNE